MAANMPMQNNPMPICIGLVAKDVSIEAMPMPIKNKTIMLRLSHLSANQPAGIAQMPKATKPGVAYGMSSA